MAGLILGPAPIVVTQGFFGRKNIYPWPYGSLAGASRGPGEHLGRERRVCRQGTFSLIPSKERG